MFFGEFFLCLICLLRTKGVGMENSHDKRSAWVMGRRLLLIQLIVVVLQALFFFVGEQFLGWNFKISASAAVSSFLGGIIYLIPFSAYTLFALRRKSSDQFVGLVLADFVIGFILKFVFLIALFVLVLKFIPTVHFVLFISFGVMFITQWVLLIVLNHQY